ncbi:MAG TPA: DNA translocase FtsK 4TM domain-containing protein [Pyrinomonadaceae bacterium]|nr:DNA translocase FtsK 4TM domain-containing protein [Pyrinomonadaceae bacterium]
MKVCPTCDKVYQDEDINFCLADGTTLLKKRGPKPAKHSHWNDVVAVIIAAVALLVFLCLITASSDDRSLISTGGGAASTRNWIGIVGANIAAVFFGGFGWTAYLIPVLIALIAWRIFQASTLIPRASRVAGFIFFAISLAGLVALVFGEQAGAIVGSAAAQGTAYLIGKIGAGILLTAIFISSLLLVTNFTLAGFMSHFEVAFDNIRIRIDEWREKRRLMRSPEINAAKLRAERRKEKRDTEPETIPPTIRIGETMAVAAAATAAGSAPLFDQPSVPTIDGDNPYETVKVAEEPPEVKEAFEKEKGKKSKPQELKPLDEEIIDGDVGPTFTEDEVGEPTAAPLASKQNFDSYKLPTTDMLTPAAPRIKQDDKELLTTAEHLTKKTSEFNVGGKVVNISKGPVVTTYEFKPDAGVKYSRIAGLAEDLCLALEAESIRIDRIPGKAYVGIEVPNKKREMIMLREVIESPKFNDSKGLLTLALGKTIDGLNYVADLAKMPHLLIAGATGAGKSVGVNTLVMSILYKARPDEVKFIMVDPKRLELGLYADIPHLATPIITDPKRAAISLKWAVTEMERRYKDLAGYGVRNIDGYNTEMRRRNEIEQWDDNGEPNRVLPYVVIIIDELADLMMVSGKDVEESITRLAQMARAVGIHLVLATQRPSVDVITGLIKANFPARISFRVSSKVDSRTIIDGNGAESLLGSGDMLFLPPGNSNVTRVHGAFVNEAEIKKVVDHIKAQGRPEYDTTITKSEEEMDDGGELPGRRDPLFNDALKSVVQAKRASTSLLQRQLRIGYGRAAAILDAMVREGYIGEMDGSSRARPILTKAYEDLQDIEEGALGE